MEQVLVYLSCPPEVRSRRGVREVKKEVEHGLDWNVCVGRPKEREGRGGSEGRRTRFRRRPPTAMSACQLQGDAINVIVSEQMPSFPSMPYASAARGRKWGKTQNPAERKGACFRSTITHPKTYSRSFNAQGLATASARLLGTWLLVRVILGVSWLSSSDSFSSILHHTVGDTCESVLSMDHSRVQYTAVPMILAGKMFNGQIELRGTVRTITLHTSNLSRC